MFLCHVKNNITCSIIFPMFLSHLVLYQLVPHSNSDPKFWGSFHIRKFPPFLRSPRGWERRRISSICPTWSRARAATNAAHLRLLGCSHGMFLSSPVIKKRGKKQPNNSGGRWIQRDSESQKETWLPTSQGCSYSSSDGKWCMLWRQSK